jgi:hypothetical protein
MSALPRRIPATGRISLAVLAATQTLGDTVTPGPVALGFHNGGKVAHEMGVVRLKEGASLAQVLAAERAGGDVESFFDGTVGILIARPGIPLAVGCW